MIRLNDIISEILSYHPKANIGLIQKAYVYSAKVHQGQIRLSGEPYLSHPLEVAYILAQMRMDVVCIAAGLLHDTLEDTTAEPEELKELFGEETANIVDGVTKISKMHFTSRKHREAENIRKMILAMSTDIRVILVKLVDRLHNMRTLGFQRPEKQREISKETLEIYAPLAARMGIHNIKTNLEDLALYYIEPEAYQKIKTEVTLRKTENKSFIQDVKELISTKLEEFGIQAIVKGRPKSFYSIYTKMVDQDLTPDQVYDVLAFRLIVNSIKECYEALGFIHAMWKPVAGRFKDYVSVPKANMYQSLHTTVIGPLGQRMEVQIRTHEMDRVAEQGIAAHWKYKEGLIASKTDEKQFSWLRQLLEWQQNLNDPEEFLDTVRMNLFPDEVYVFTPKGEVKSFPRGATAVDFAYSIHSEVGEKCMGARINGRMVPLRQQLKNGNIVEIVTSSKQHPSKDWLEFVKTPRAKTKIKQWLKNQERDESVNLGKSMLEKALEQERLNLPNIMKSEQILAIAEDLSFHTAEDLVAQIGFGEVSLKQVVGRLKTKMGVKPEKPTGIVSKMLVRLRRTKADRGIKVKGIGEMLIRFANCCNPLPGEPVIGFITRGRGVTIHHQKCRHIQRADPERLVEVSWESSKEDVYIAKLRVISVNQKGMLADISAVITKNNGNIMQADIKTTMDQKGISHFTVEVGNYKQLEDIMRGIKKLKHVLIVERL
ncbi:MAG TPA: bifunctional (p)ppGpp synthetase/guanosine-3',5'-bis(diphosphate) 3'-pyrophosphohydrolase [Desulfobacteraceae bacterium]|nr:bifunctional (p)ppGpp synthetase/guanosine-3',5'-bis(diphosphate) 3'-pyrophosphohydrolase [Desulfobacteraceae bacterium]HPJ66259.1 bifunctional (p)ppGpp synthetase/guanosine-3',5'-bis(diphosphate) 3'-pyrophosphohydrolase [Desulfobacteraceae bacterium]HPQ27145.1 bifunctional (p)ppGpp synthetase/guanosine-3',5'-bis(diphosphate) 3'-pyrophosphohydrolase [Desulfobacteraceae bacterium]